MTDSPKSGDRGWCRNCQKPIRWVPYLGSGTGAGFWMHATGNAQRRCDLVAAPTRTDEHGIEYIP